MKYARELWEEAKRGLRIVKMLERDRYELVWHERDRERARILTRERERGRERKRERGKAREGVMPSMEV